LSCRLGLVIVDESTSTVRLVHKSLQDYIKIQYDKGTIFTDGHNHVAHICLTYMSFDSYDKEVLTLRNEIFKKYALLKYATSSWAYHSRNSKNPEETEDMAFYLLHEKFESRSFECFFHAMKHHRPLRYGTISSIICNLKVLSNWLWKKQVLQVLWYMCLYLRV
jgi:hypothetical protein